MTLVAFDQGRSVLWAQSEMARALSTLSRLRKHKHFPVHDGTRECYRLVGAAAALLSFEHRSEIACVADFSTGMMSTSLGENSDRDVVWLAENWSGGMMSYVEFLQARLHFDIRPRLLRMISQLFNRHVEAYLSAEPDFHPDVIVALSYDLFYAVADDGMHAGVAAVQTIVEELSSVDPATSSVDFDIGTGPHPADMSDDGAALFSTATPGVGRPTTLDHIDRLNRLVARRDELRNSEMSPRRLGNLDRIITEVSGWLAASHTSRVG